MESLFVDTSAWVALFDSEDKFHNAATTLWQNLQDERPRLVTNDYVMDETFTNLRRSINGLERAMRAREIIEQSKLIEIVEVGPEHRERAWLLFRKYEDKVLSFTDCVCFAMMHQRGIYQVFAFDSDYSRAGFLVRP
jgi:predicted nucleic acid-binding protein